ncbi:hypothetical protein LOD99_14581 [Oopsacas minuta]|uniref:Uncharacterized protein n=1 Tax=Oopsacas minuta TaxID=111878 RepID=A0AAV7KEQ5_9METZ|nr:hypothetical protein LOD99_14581 [Oopsacas minuta]
MEGANCEVFATAACLALATGLEPSKIRWRQIHMRAHIKECFRTEIVRPFPSITQMTLRSKFSTAQVTVLSITVSCVCTLPAHAYKYMIECLDCSTRHHKAYVGYQDPERDIPSFICCKVLQRENGVLRLLNITSW